MRLSFSKIGIIAALVACWLFPFRLFAYDFVGDGFGVVGRSLGGAVMATRPQPDALFVNPAALAGVEHAMIQTAYNYQFGGAASEYLLSGVLPLGSITLAGALPINMVSGIPQTRESVSSGQGEQIGTVSQLYSAALLGAALQLNSDLSLGLTGRAYYLSLDAYHGLGVGGDLGLKWQMAHDLALGLSARHLGGTTLRWNSGASETYATQYALGLSGQWDIDGLKLSSELDGVYLSDTHQTVLRAGAELGLARFLSLRGGYHGESNELSLGLGLDLPEFSLDYALVNHDVLGMSHQVMLSFKL